MWDWAWELRVLVLGMQVSDVPQFSAALRLQHTFHAHAHRIGYGNLDVWPRTFTQTMASRFC